MDPGPISRLFRHLDRELWLVTARAGDRRGGLIATFVGQASLVEELPRVVVGLSRQHHTRGLVEASDAFALHLLSERHLDLVWRFGLRSGRDADKLAGLDAREGRTGSPLLADALGWMDCRVEARLETGDRTLYLAEVLDGGFSGTEPALTLRRMWELAPDDRRRELKAQLDRDAAVDADAIRAWRLADGP